VSEEAFAVLVASLPGDRGLLVTDELADGGGAYGSGEQKVALLVRERFELTHARVILADETWAFAGRPPIRGVAVIHGAWPTAHARHCRGALQGDGQ